MYVDHESRTAFYHVPKTGGTWVAQAFEQTFNTTLEIHIARHAWVVPEYTRCTVATIRHPLSWYQSAWAHMAALGRMRAGVPDAHFLSNSAQWDFFNHCIDFDFKKCIQNAIDRYGDRGIVSRIYEEHGVAEADHILLQERLFDDFVCFVEQRFPGNVVPDFLKDEKVNFWPKFRELAVFDDEHIRKLLVAEVPAIDLWRGYANQRGVEAIWL